MGQYPGFQVPQQGLGYRPYVGFVMLIKSRCNNIFPLFQDGRWFNTSDTQYRIVL